uniref:Uncharacterized protein n=1 Tax=Picea glauca TaxID=3330 RepID=A0A101LWK7_PICGL|nr:hypothetical protein ABT39_MTgene1346 [Picea glauca]QHR89500.1 hypothetical protein Q903MT_gene3521 [Picea sitchensis]
MSSFTRDIWIPKMPYLLYRSQLCMPMVEETITQPLSSKLSNQSSHPRRKSSRRPIEEPGKRISHLSEPGSDPSSPAPPGKERDKSRYLSSG